MMVNMPLLSNRTHRTRAFAIAVGAIVFASCQSLTYTAEGSMPPHARPVLLARPVYIADLIPPFEVDVDAFNANLFVGRIVFSGGVIRDATRGNIYRSARVALEGEASYRSSIGDLVYDAVARGLRWPNVRGIDGVVSEGRIVASFTRRSDLVQRDGRFLRVDSINVPYREYTVGLVPGSLSMLRELGGSSDGIFVVPFIEYGYSHTAGWFNDQESGCLAGVRLAVHILGIDLATGETVFSFAEDFRIVDDFSSVLSEFAIAELFGSIGDTLTDHIGAAIGKR